MKERVIYRNATLLEGSDLKVREDAYLVVEADQIIDLGTTPLYEGMDLDGALVIPAFVNAHTHIGDGIAKEAGVGLSAEEAVSPPDGLKYRYLNELSAEGLSRSLESAIEELLRNGITAFGDFREGGVEGTLALRSIMEGKPLKVVIFGAATANPGQEGYLTEQEGVAGAAHGLGIGDVALFSETELASLKSLLAAGGKKLAVHGAETKAAQELCFNNWRKSEIIRILDFSPELFVHLTNPFPGDLEAIAEQKIPVVCCARTNCILADGLPPLDKMIELKMQLALGTDNLMFSSPDMFREMDWFSRLARGQSGQADIISSKEVLSIATLGGARALGLEDRLGSLEAGKAASFIVLNTGSLALRNCRNLYSAAVHRASPADILLIVSWGREVFQA